MTTNQSEWKIDTYPTGVCFKVIDKFYYVYSNTSTGVMIANYGRNGTKGSWTLTSPTKVREKLDGKKGLFPYRQFMATEGISLPLPDASDVSGAPPELIEVLLAGSN